MKYQLVLQFNEDLGLERLIEIENSLIDTLHADVDGHDIGSGQMNIFIFTDTPEIIAKEILSILELDPYLTSSAKIAYRKVESDSFVCLWPVNLREFYVL
jgi:hypothetical protein